MAGAPLPAGAIALHSDGGTVLGLPGLRPEALVGVAGIRRRGGARYVPALGRAGAITSGALSLTLITAGGAAASVRASVTVSPFPGTSVVMPQAQISFLGAPVGDLRGISVVGSSSGSHSGRLRPYASAAGASFLPSRPFTPGEQVTVHVTLIARGGTRALSTHFTIARPERVTNAEFPTVSGTPSEIQSFQSRPDLHPPVVTINQSTASASPGYLFATPFIGPGQYGPMIFDDAGDLVWFRPLPEGQDAADLQVQSYKGARDLTWWQGRTIILGYGLGEDVIANSAYHTVAVVKAGNGLMADEHEFTVTPQGTALITAYSPVQANLSSAGGPASGIAVDCAVQEIDIRTGLVMWEWHSLGHVDVSESHSKAPTGSETPYDYFHLNSVQLLANGNFLISARNTWTAYELDSHTGAIIWRLGGKRSTFTLGPGVPFAWQHNARELPDGEISIFDDEGAPPIHPPSRGEFIKLDPRTRTATLAGQLVRSSGPLSTGSQGNVQQLADGNWMVGWGGLPNFTEFNAGGEIVFDGQFPPGESSYRVYREAWSGAPTEAPAIAATASGASTTVYASWNGATRVSRWQLLSGPSPRSLTPVLSTPREGFQTNVTIPTRPYVQIRALSAAGRTLGSSATIKPAGG